MPLAGTLVFDKLTDAVFAHEQEIVSIGFVVLATVVLARVVSVRVPRHFPSTSSLVVSALRISIVLVGTLIVLSSLGIAITPVLTALGVGGIAVALALRDTLANLFAGFQLLASRQVAPGDFVRFDGGEGYVADITWRNTSITDLAGARVIVPNEKLAGSIVTNATRPGGLHISYAFGLSPSLDIAAMLSALRTQMSRLGVVDVRVVAQNEAAVTCAAVLVIAAGGDAFAARAALAEAVATLARFERAPRAGE
ncbi:MAG: hypothetical protein NVSMB64_08340 [Candidatus Velthaea sp.]